MPWSKGSGLWWRLDSVLVLDLASRNSYVGHMIPAQIRKHKKHESKLTGMRTSVSTCVDLDLGIPTGTLLPVEASQVPTHKSRTRTHEKLGQNLVKRPFLKSRALKLKFGHRVAHDMRNLHLASRNLNSWYFMIYRHVLFRLNAWKLVLPTEMLWPNDPQKSRVFRAGGS